MTTEQIERLVLIVWFILIVILSYGIYKEFKRPTPKRFK